MLKIGFPETDVVIFDFPEADVVRLAFRKPVPKGLAFRKPVMIAIRGLNYLCIWWSYISHRMIFVCSRSSGWYFLSS